MSKPQLEIRRLAADDRGARQLAIAAGVHGVYVQNALAEGLRDGLVFVIDGIESGVAWFGPRGNLVLVAEPSCYALAEEIAGHVRTNGWPWRIAMGPPEIVDALREHQKGTPLVCRDQTYYLADEGSAVTALVRDDLRRPGNTDRERLARATLALNASDLNIAPARVDRRWLYNTIDERIREGSTRVLGPIGSIWCKLDFGSQGPGGLVIEGVFTFPDRRGRGLAAELVASCIAEAACPVSLHVAEHNRAARSCYERAGMRKAGTCRLLLIG